MPLYEIGASDSTQVILGLLELLFLRDALVDSVQVTIQVTIFHCLGIGMESSLVSSRKSARLDLVSK